MSLGGDGGRTRLGDLLVAEGLLTGGQLNIALAEQRESRERLGSILVRRRLVPENDLLRVLGNHFGVDFVDLEDLVVDPHAAKLLPESAARRAQAIPIRFEASKLVVAMASPADVFALDDIRTITKWRITPVLATPEKIFAALDRHWGRGPSVNLTAPRHQAPGAPAPHAAPPPAPAQYPAVPPTPGPSAAGAALSAFAADDQSAVPTTTGDTSVTSPAVTGLVNDVLSRAVRDRASEVHFDAVPGELRVRFRVDGMLREVLRVPGPLRASVVTRLKILGELDIGERRLPQDGWIALDVAGRRVDVRLLTLPTADGESVSLRMREGDGDLFAIDGLGFLPEQFRQFRDAVGRPSGAVIVAGPTGSGRSTTLYAAVASLNDPTHHVVTVEDPIEVRIPGVRQVHVHPETGLSFASALRSALQSSPDVALVGHVPDGDTARLVAEGALMGHLMLAAMHAHDAPTALLRLVDLGVEPYMASSAVTCVVAQRLLRRLCETCKVPDQQPALGHRLLSGQAVVDPTFYRPLGCQDCEGTGYRGRLAIQEVLRMSDELGRLLAAGASVTKVQEAAVAAGMVPLIEDGFAKAALGRTSMDELRRLSG